MKIEEIEEIIKAHTSETFVIERFEEDAMTGETMIIVKFEDVTKAKDFVRTISESNDSTVAIIRRIEFVMVNEEGISPMQIPFKLLFLAILCMLY